MTTPSNAMALDASSTVRNSTNAKSLSRFMYTDRTHVMPLSGSYAPDAPPIATSAFAMNDASSGSLVLSGNPPT